MTNRTFLVLVIVVALLMAALIYMHQPRSAATTRSLAPHGDL